MGKSMPPEKVYRFSAAMVAHLMENMPTLPKDGTERCSDVAGPSNDSQLEVEALVSIRKERTHHSSESSEQPVYSLSLGEKKEAQVRFKLHDRKKFNDSVIIIDHRNEAGQCAALGFLKLGSVFRVHLEESFLLVANRFVAGKDSLSIPSKPIISISNDFLPPDLCRLVQNADRTGVMVRIEHVPPAQLSGKDGSQLDNVQLQFKELYLSRADMWRMRKALIGKCLFQDRDIVSSVLNVNLRISDLWSKGQEVRHGYVSSDTRVVFRSSSSMVIIYIQVSTEMFSIDETGYMLFEKSSLGFISDLLSRWQDSLCSHYVSIIMCSRWFFKSQPSEEAIQMENLTPDHKGRYYQDFYKLIVQNEHYEDWGDCCGKVFDAFTDYCENIIKELERRFPNLSAKNFDLCKAKNGNFLESLNMSMNMFCMYHNDRRYETTGQQIIYVTAGPGVFHIDEKAVHPTKQRLIDMGISLDMVCLGGQPLYVTPLFIFHNRLREIYKYYIPHWMNYSYYRMVDTDPVTRAILPEDFDLPSGKLTIMEEEDMIEEIEDEDEHVEGDTDGDQLESNDPNRQRDHMGKLLEAAKLTGYENSDTDTDQETENTSTRSSIGSSLSSLDETNEDIEDQQNDYHEDQGLVTSDLDISPEFVNEEPPLEEEMSTADRNTFMQLIAQNDLGQNLAELLNRDLFPKSQSVFPSITPTPPKTLPGCRFSSISGVPPPPKERAIGAASLEGPTGNFDIKRGGGSLESTKRIATLVKNRDDPQIPSTSIQNRKDLIPPPPLHFPYKPDSHVVMTANRRRWIHVFPMDERGMSKLAHHMVQGRSIVNVVDAVEEPPSSTLRHIPVQGAQNESPLRRAASPQAIGIHQGSPGRLATTSPFEGLKQTGPRTWAWAWGSTGEEKWNPDIIIGTDWKSLIRSALLPITTDFFPEGFTLRNQYKVHGHQVLVDSSLIEDIPGAKSLSLSELSHLVFDQLICQRLQRGFQIVTLKKSLIKSSIDRVGRFPHDEGFLDDEVTLTFSNIYHRLVRKRNDIYVTLFIPDPNRRQFYEIKQNEGRLSRRSGPVKTVTEMTHVVQPGTSPKDRVQEEIIRYQYYFQVPDADGYEKSTTSFKPHNLDKLNWSLLDTKLTYRSKDELKGYSQLFKDEMKSYSSRFMLVPQSPDQMLFQNILTHKMAGETFRQKGFSQQEIYANFTKFLMTLNKLTHTRREMDSGDMMAPSLTLANPEQILSRFLEKCAYVPLQSTTQTGSVLNNHFLSIDLINWLMENVAQLSTREKAIDFVGAEPRIGTIRLSPNEADELDSCRSLDVDRRPIRYGFHICSITNDQADPAESTPSPSRYMRVDYVNHCETSSTKDECRYARGAIDVELTPKGTIDEGNVLGEWCRIVYEKGFSEDKSFEMTIKWFLASGVTVGEAIRSWVTKAESFKFNLFPVPEDVFALPNDVHSNPLRCPIRIQLATGVIPSDKLASTLRQMLSAFGFLSMYCGRHGTPGQPRSYQVIHECGGMFVSVEERVDEEKAPLVFWSWNHMLSHRYRPAELKEIMEEFQDYMLREFRDICLNLDGRLRKFYANLCLQNV